MLLAENGMEDEYPFVCSQLTDIIFQKTVKSFYDFYNLVIVRIRLCTCVLRNSTTIELVNILIFG